MRSLRNQRGAASVLVILLIVVLATFGAVAIMATWTQNGMSIRTAERAAAYYTLDGEAEQIIAKVDEGLYEAQKKATIYMDTLYRDDAVPEDIENVPSSFRGEVRRTPPNLTMRSMLVEDVYTRIYYCYAAQALQPICEKLGAKLTLSTLHGNAVGYMNFQHPSPAPEDLTVSFQLLDPSGMMLDVTLGINCDHYQVTSGEGEEWKKELTMIPRESRERVQILKWKQCQQSKDSDQALPYNGTVKKK